MIAVFIPSSTHSGVGELALGSDRKVETEWEVV